MFEGEDRRVFERKIEKAQKYRQMSEVFVKYNYVIDKQMDEPESQLIKLPSSEQMDRVMLFVFNLAFKVTEPRNPIRFYELDPSQKYNAKRYLIPKLIHMDKKDFVGLFKARKYELGLLNALKKEVDLNFVRSNLLIQFNNALPYSLDLQKMYRGFLDEHLFVPINQKPTAETADVGCLDVDYQEPSRPHYQALFKKISKVLHQANSMKLKTLLELNGSMIKFDQLYFFIDKMTKVYTLEEYRRVQESRFNETLRDFKSKMYDTHFEIMEMVDMEIRLMKKRNEELRLKIIIESERKKFEETELPPDTIQSLRSF